MENNNMVTILNAPRYRLEAIVRNIGYTKKEIKTFTIKELRECIWMNFDRPDPEERYSEA